MAINSAIALGGIALQPDLDHPAAYPDHGHGLTGGNPWAVNRTLAEDATTCGIRAIAAVYTSAIEANPTFELRLFPNVLGVYLRMMLGACVSEPATDVGEGYFRHTFTLAKDQPYATVFGLMDEGYAKTESCKVSQGVINCEGTDPLGLNLDFLGCEPIRLTEDPFAGVEPECYGGRFLPADAEILLSPDDEARTDALVTSLSFTINNNCEGKTAVGAPWAAEVVTKNLTAAISVAVSEADFERYWRVYLSKSTGRVSKEPIYGSLYSKFFCSDDPDITLEITADKIPWNAEIPAADPSGGDGDVTFSTDNALIEKDNATPITFVLVNKVPDYELPVAPSAETATASAVTETSTQVGNHTLADLVGEDWAVTQDGYRIVCSGTANQIADWDAYPESERNKWYPLINVKARPGAVIEVETLGGVMKRIPLDTGEEWLSIACKKGAQRKVLRVYPEADSQFYATYTVDLTNVTWGPAAAPVALKAKKAVTAKAKAEAE